MSDDKDSARVPTWDVNEDEADKDTAKIDTSMMGSLDIGASGNFKVEDPIVPRKRKANDLHAPPRERPGTSESLRRTPPPSIPDQQSHFDDLSRSKTAAGDLIRPPNDDRECCQPQKSLENTLNSTYNPSSERK